MQICMTNFEVIYQYLRLIVCMFFYAFTEAVFSNCHNGLSLPQTGHHLRANRWVSDQWESIWRISSSKNNHFFLFICMLNKWCANWLKCIYKNNNFSYKNYKYRFLHVFPNIALINYSDDVYYFRTEKKRIVNKFKTRVSTYKCSISSIKDKIK